MSMLRSVTMPILLGALAAASAACGNVQVNTHNHQAAPMGAAPTFPSTTALINRSGAGDQTTSSFSLPAGNTVFAISCSSCQGTFAVQLLGPGTSDVPLIHSQGAANTSRTQSVSGGTYRLAVVADASWRISITPAR